MKASIVSRGLEQWQDDVLSLIFPIDQPFVFSDWFLGVGILKIELMHFVQLEILPKKTAN